MFNTIEIPKPQTPSCAGGCSPAPSPAASTSISSDPSLKLRPISPQRQRMPSPARLPPIELATSYQPNPSGQSSREWNGYLEFGLQPSEVDLAPLYVPFPSTPDQQQVQVPLQQGGGGEKRTASIWDIEELVPAPPPSLDTATQYAKKPRTVASPPQQELPLPPPSTAISQQGETISARASPSSESEPGLANEVVTVSLFRLSQAITFVVLIFKFRSSSLSSRNSITSSIIPSINLGFVGTLQ